MTKRIFTLLLSLLTIVGAQAQLLWRISGNGLTRPSYVLGSYHLAQASFADSIPQLREVLNNCEQVYGEMDMQNAMTNATSLQKLQESMMLPAGTTLQTLLTAEEQTRLNAFLTNTLGADLSNPMLAPLAQMKPAAVLTQLQAALCLKMYPGFNPTDQFDTYFQKVAQQNGKPIGGFETVDQQIDVLFNGTSLKRQAEQLMCLVDHPDYEMAEMKRIIEAFYAQDINTLGQAMTEKRHNSCDYTPEEEDRLIFTRNNNWAKALPAVMKAKQTLVVVGAGHLPGERGLLELLRKAGYEVTPCK